MPSVKTYLDQRVPAQKSKRQSGQSTTMLLHCHPEFISGCCPVCSCFLLRSTISSAGFTAGIAMFVQHICSGWHSCRGLFCWTYTFKFFSLFRTVAGAWFPPTPPKAETGPRTPAGEEMCSTSQNAWQTHWAPRLQPRHPEPKRNRFRMTMWMYEGYPPADGRYLWLVLYNVYLLWLWWSAGACIFTA